MYPNQPNPVISLGSPFTEIALGHVRPSDAATVRAVVHNDLAEPVSLGSPATTCACRGATLAASDLAAGARTDLDVQGEWPHRLGHARIDVFVPVAVSGTARGQLQLRLSATVSDYISCVAQTELGEEADARIMRFRLGQDAAARFSVRRGAFPSPWSTFSITPSVAGRLTVSVQDGGEDGWDAFVVPADRGIIGHVTETLVFRFNDAAGMRLSASTERTVSLIIEGPVKAVPSQVLFRGTDAAHQVRLLPRTSGQAVTITELHLEAGCPIAAAITADGTGISLSRASRPETASAVDGSYVLAVNLTCAGTSHRLFIPIFRLP